MTYYHCEAWWQGGDDKLLYLHMTKIESKPTYSRFWATVFQFRLTEISVFTKNQSERKNILKRNMSIFHKL